MESCVSRANASLKRRFVMIVGVGLFFATARDIIGVIDEIAQINRPVTDMARATEQQSTASDKSTPPSAVWIR